MGFGGVVAEWGGGGWVGMAENLKEEDVAEHEDAER